MNGSQYLIVKRLKRHSEYDIKPLYRGVGKEDSQKVIVIHQAPEENVQKFVKANGD